MTTLDTNARPIKVRLSQPRLDVTCRIVFHDGTATAVGVNSPSIPGAQAEITSWLIEQGYEPAGLWSTEVDAGRETMRTFRRRPPGDPPPGARNRDD